MKKPLLTAKEYDLLKDFSAEANLSLLPKLLPINISITKVTDKSAERTPESLEKKLTAQLKSHRILNKDPSRPVYYYDFQVLSLKQKISNMSRVIRSVFILNFYAKKLKT